jgi:peptidyl-prolyl cis-trans isomerase D
MGAVVGLLVLAFAAWGIGDIFRGPMRGALATVGNAKISVEQFRQLYQTKLQEVSQQLRRPITPEQARAFGFDRQVLAQWLQDATLDQVVQDMRLGVADTEVVRRVTEDPAFRGPGGQFDPGQFRTVLQRNGQSEQGYIAEQRRETLRRQIATTVNGDIQPPKAAAEAINRYENEQRDADYVVLTRAQAGDIPPPTPDVLAKYFEERKVLFRAPRPPTIRTSPASRCRRGARSSRSSFRTRTRRTRRPSAWRPASRSTTSPRSASSARRTSTSA